MQEQRIARKRVSTLLVERSEHENTFPHTLSSLEMS